DRLVHVLEQLALGDVEHLDLQGGARLGVHDQVVHAAPGPLQLLEVGVVQHGGELLGQGRVQGGDALFDRLRDVTAVGERALEGLVGQGRDQLLGPRPLGLLGGRNHLIKEAALLLDGRTGGRRRRLLWGRTHDLTSSLLAPSSDWSFFSSSVFWSTLSRRASRSSERSTLLSRSRSLSRVSRILRSGSTCWTMRPGSKSSMWLNFSCTGIWLPSFLRVFSTLRFRPGVMRPM